MTSLSHRLVLVLFPTLCFLCITQPAIAQDTVTGAFEGIVSNGKTKAPIKDADVQIINEQTGLVILLRTDSDGRFYEGQLAPGSTEFASQSPAFRPKKSFKR